MTNRNEVKLAKTIPSMAILFTFCALLGGCIGFKLNQDVKGKTITFDHIKFCYYIQNHNGKKELQVKYKQKTCSILGFVQNHDHTLTALKVGLHVSKVYQLANSNKSVKMPVRYIILVSGTKIIYQIEAPEMTLLQWIKNDQLIITKPFQKLVIDKNGKVIMNKDFKENQLLSVSNDTIF